MARGFGAVKAAAEDINARKAAGGAGGGRYFRLDEGESAIVRFLEQDDDVRSAWVHELPAADGKQWGPRVPCRDQDEEGRRTGADCPGCEQGMKRTFRMAINLIQRDAPVFLRDTNNKIVKGSDNKPIAQGNADQLAIWTAGINVAEDLYQINADYKGLCSRDFRVTRRGTGLNTRYSVAPADPDGGRQEMSEEDKKLADEKGDLAFFVEAPSYETWGKAPAASERPKQQDSVVATDSTSPFKRKIQSSS